MPVEPMERTQFRQFFNAEREEFVLTSLREGIEIYLDSANYSPAARRDHSERTAAACTNDHVVKCARRLVLENPDVRHVRRGGRDFFILGERVRLSFKKLDDDLRPRNNPTRQSNDFLSQELWDDGDAPERLTNIVAGYRLDDTATSAKFYITCPLAHRNLWELQIGGDDSARLLPDERGTPPSDAPSRVRIRPGVVETGRHASA